MANPRIKPGLGKPMVDGKSFRLAGEVRHTGRVISIGQLILFSTKTGDAWLLDPSDQLAARLAREGDPEPIHIEETDTTFAIGWKGHYRIEGPAFVYVDRDTGRTSTILGYPTNQLTQSSRVRRARSLVAPPWPRPGHRRPAP